MFSVSMHVLVKAEEEPSGYICPGTHAKVRAGLCVKVFVCAHGGVTNKDGHIYISTDKQIDCSSHKQGGFRHWRKK